MIFCGLSIVFVISILLSLRGFSTTSIVNGQCVNNTNWQDEASSIVYAVTGLINGYLASVVVFAYSYGNIFTTMRRQIKIFPVPGCPKATLLRDKHQRGNESSMSHQGHGKKFSGVARKLRLGGAKLRGSPNRRREAPEN